MSVFSSDQSLLHCKMASLTPSSANISLTQAVAFGTKKSNILSRRSILRNVNKDSLTAQKHTLPFSTSIRLFPQFHIGCVLKPRQRTLAASASGTDVAVEETEAEASPEASGESPPVPEASPVKSQRARPSRRSEMPPVKNEELIAGATFTGKVRSIQPFGAFVDFGAFTDGLVHVSQLSDSYVKDVSTVVSVGQEVTVRLVEANIDTGRISLSMRSGEDSSKGQQQRESQGGSDRSRPPRRTGQSSNQRRDEPKTFSKFSKGQDLEGTVKSLARAGAFISLPEGEEGFLPISEESDDGFGNVMGVTSLEVGQEVKVRVLRLSRGKATLTMKKDEDVVQLDSKLSGVVHTATNPFVRIFRSNPDIAAFLDEQENENQKVEKAEEIATDSDETAAKALVKEDVVEKISEDSETKDENVEAVEEVEASSGLVAEEPSLTEGKESNDEEVSGEVADISSQVVEVAKEDLVDDSATTPVVETEKDIEVTNEASPDVAVEETPIVADDIVAEDEVKSVEQENEVTTAIDPVESDSSDSSSAEAISAGLCCCIVRFIYWKPFIISFIRKVLFSSCRKYGCRWQFWSRYIREWCRKPSFC